MPDTSFSKQSAATRFIAAIERGWCRWNASQVEAAHHMFQRSVDPLTGRGASGEALIDLCLTELGAFTGPDAEQEDDITLVSLERTMSAVYAGGDT